MLNGDVVVAAAPALVVSEEKAAALSQILHLELAASAARPRLVNLYHDGKVMVRPKDALRLEWRVVRAVDEGRYDQNHPCDADDRVACSLRASTGA